MLVRDSIVGLFSEVLVGHLRSRPSAPWTSRRPSPVQPPVESVREKFLQVTGGEDSHGGMVSKEGTLFGTIDGGRDVSLSTIASPVTCPRSSVPGTGSPWCPGPTVRVLVLLGTVYIVV